MSRLYVPVIINGDVSLFDVECNEHEDGLLINGNSPDEDAGIQTLADKAASFQKSFCGGGDASAQILISDRDREADAEIQFDDSTQSVTLGVLVELYRCLTHGSYKDKWDYIVTTGDWSPKSNSVDSVDKIAHKFEAVKELAREDPSKRIIFVYVDSGLPLRTGYSKEFPNVFVSGFKSGADFREIKAEILKPEFSGEQEELLKKADRFSLENFYETETYLSLKASVRTCKGYVIDGRSDSGKTILASALVQYAMETKLVYAPVWIRINNYELNELLTAKVNRKGIGTESASYGSVNKHKVICGYLQKRISGKLSVSSGKSYLLVIDNIEYDFIDDILSALKEFIAKNTWIRFMIITSWEKTKKADSLDSLDFKEVSLSQLNQEDFRGVYQTILREEFTTNLQKATDEERQALENLLYSRLKTNPGSIKRALNALNELSVPDLIAKIKDSGLSASDSETLFYSLSFSRLGLFAQIVLYEFIAGFGYKNEACAKSGFDNIRKGILHDKLIDNSLLSASAIEKAFRQIEANYLLMENADGYSIKSDTLRYLLFQHSSDDFVDTLEKKCLSAIIKGAAAIYYAWYDELRKIVNDNPWDVKDLLFYAGINSSNLEVLRTIAESHGCELDAMDKYGQNILHTVAAYNSNPDLLRYLLKLNKSFPLKTKDNTSVLHFAATNDNCEMLEYILKNRIYDDIDEANDTGMTAFLVAARESNKAESLWILASYGCDKLARDENGSSALHFASENENIEIITCIIENGWYESIDEPDDEGTTAFLLSVRYNDNIEVAKYLLRCGARFDTRDETGESVLMSAACNKNKAALELVLDRYLSDNDINEADKEGWTALHYAAQDNPNPEVLDILISHGADLMQTTNDGESVFSLAMKYNESEEVVSYLLDSIFEEKYVLPDDKRSLVLNAVAFNKNVNIIKLLREKEYDFSVKTDKGESVIHHAVYNKNLEVLRYILLHHIYEDIDETDDAGMTALHHASRFANNTEYLTLLLQAGSDWKLRTKEGMSILHLATVAENAEKLKYIVNNKLYEDIDELDNHGVSALYIAMHNPNLEVVELILKAKAGYAETSSGSISSAGWANQKTEAFTLSENAGSKVGKDSEDRVLREAVRSEKKGLVQKILNNKRYSDINAGDVDGMSPLLIAAITNHGAEIMDMLIKNGSDWNKPSNDGQTLVMCASVNASGNPLEYVLDNKLYDDINYADAAGVTVLLNAAIGTRNSDNLIRLVKAGADLYARTSYGETILHLAAVNSNAHVVRTVVERLHFEDVEAKSFYGKTALHFAAETKNFEVFEYLYHLGLSPTEPDNNGATALDLVPAEYKDKYTGLIAKFSYA